MSLQNHQISLQQAIDMTTLYRANLPSGAPLYETFEKQVILDLISSGNAAFLRIYYGMAADNKIHAILVAADSEEQDILPSSTQATAAGAPVIVEDGLRCPQYCPSKSALSGNEP